MEIIAIIGLIIGIVGIILILLINKYNKYQVSLIKLHKGEINIVSNLENKYNILLRYVDILKNEIEINEEEFEEYKLLNVKMPMIKLDKKLNSLNNIIDKYLDSNEKLLKNESIVNIEKELLNANIKIDGCKKYYNDNLIIYNHLCHSFPSSIIGKICHYREKEFIEQENEEQLKILNE